MSDLAIRAAGLGKRYLLGARQEACTTPRDSIIEHAMVRDVAAQVGIEWTHLS